MSEDTKTPPADPRQKPLSPEEAKTGAPLRTPKPLAEDATDAIAEAAELATHPPMNR